MDIRLRTGEILTEYEFRQRYSNTSFPNMITSDILNDSRLMLSLRVLSLQGNSGSMLFEMV